jgi:hypothetical protein
VGSSLAARLAVSQRLAAETWLVEPVTRHDTPAAPTASEPASSEIAIPVGS